MAGLRAAAASSVMNTGTSAKTVLQITTPANQGARLSKWGIHFGGISPTAGKIDVEILTAATGGTGSALTVQKRDGHAGSVQCTAKEDFSAEPTGGNIIDSKLIHPQSGIELVSDLVIPPNSTWAIRVTAPASVECRAFAEFEE